MALQLTQKDLKLNLFEEKTWAAYRIHNEYDHQNRDQHEVRTQTKLTIKKNEDFSITFELVDRKWDFRGCYESVS